MRFLALFWAAAAAAQTGASTTSLPNVTVRGVVTDAVSGQPIADYVVSINRPGGGFLNAPTDAQGRFSLRDLPPGQYKRSVGSGRWVPVASRTITVAGEDIDSIEIRVLAEGTISGKVVDELKEPVPGVGVFLVVREYYQGNVQYLFRGHAATDAKGQYTLSHVATGRPFLVMATRRDGVVGAPLPAYSDAPENPKLRRPVFRPAFYPNSPDKERALAVTLRSGERRENVDIELKKGPGFCVEGSLQDGASGKRLVIESAQPRMGAGNGLNFYTRMPQAAVDPQGQFRICNLSPGTYRLSSQQDAQQDGSTLRFAAAEIAIIDRDIRNVKLSPVAAYRLDGETVWTGSAPEKAAEAKLALMLQPIARTRLTGETVEASTEIPGAFSFPALLIDDYAVHATLKAPGLYVKDIQYGGQTVFHQPLRPGSAMAGTGLKVLVARDGATLSVRVTDKDGGVVADSHILILPGEAASEAAIADTLISGQTDQSGQYTSPAIAPGKYYVAASEDGIDYTPESIGRLWRSRARFDEVELTPVASRQLTLRPVHLN